MGGLGKRIFSTETVGSWHDNASAPVKCGSQVYQLRDLLRPRRADPVNSLHLTLLKLKTHETEDRVSGGGRERAELGLSDGYGSLENLTRFRG